LVRDFVHLLLSGDEILWYVGAGPVVVRLSA
jgi:hypothetical protein